MRLFLAIELPESVRRHLGEVQEQLRVHVRNASWTRATNLHVTLKFLGETPDDRLAELCDTLKGIPVSGPMQFRMDGLELFPAGGPIRIVAAAVEGDVERLRTLVGAMDAALLPLGFPKESREYRPHVTLARARSPIPSSLRRGLIEAAGAHWPGRVFEAAEYVLMQSHLRQEGPEYVPLARYALSRSGGT